MRHRQALRFSVGAKGVGIVVAVVGAFGATTWIVSTSAGSSGQAETAGISNLTLTAVAWPTATSHLYRGSAGDVVVRISNANPNPVTITAVRLPTSTTDAAGYTRAR